MADIVLTTLNAKYIHCSLALRYLYANLGELRDAAVVREHLIKEHPVNIAEQLLADEPRIVGFGVYIWNVDQTLEVVRTLKSVRPDVIVVLGGPEVSHETDEQAITALADYVICGEGERAFATLCAAILAGEPPGERVIQGGLPDLRDLVLPYAFYSDDDIAQRFIYVEASRGCPYRCEFCLSSLDKAVRTFDLDALCTAMDTLLERGAKHFRFIDRTFNLDLQTSTRLLEFFLDRMREGLFVHFEVVPDRFPEALRSVVMRFPAGVLQFEVGIQTFDPATARRIGRPHKRAKIEENLRFLYSETHAHVHADLIVGLPGEDVASFGRGFDALVGMGPDEIQVGILKRLRGTPIARHTEEWGMVYRMSPPYEVLANNRVDFAQMQEMKRFARAWDLVANRGNFKTAVPLLWHPDVSPFNGFLVFSRWLSDEVGVLFEVSLTRLVRAILKYLTSVKGLDEEAVRTALASDYSLGGLRRLPKFLEGPDLETPSRRRRTGLNRRQERHNAS